MNFITLSFSFNSSLKIGWSFYFIVLDGKYINIENETTAKREVL